MALVTHQSYGDLQRSTAACTVQSARSSDHVVTGWPHELGGEHRPVSPFLSMVTDAMPGASRLPGKWRRLLVIALTGGGVAMIPWLALLGCFLPRTATVAHWNVAWVGLDALEVIGLFATGKLIARGDRRYAATATLAGTALLVDAWFDILTAASRSGLLTAVVMAGLVELPLSCVCFFLAFRAVPGPRGPQRKAATKGSLGVGAGEDRGEGAVQRVFPVADWVDAGRVPRVVG